MKKNIDARGRRIRAFLGAGAIIAALILWLLSPDRGRLAGKIFLILGASGIFMLFEAARGWCLLRACGIRTFI
ncbi:MAG: DUF2892 domain-containing protein [Elusimicrobia bacterium]|nr:DUF2892 domain-containing protein [Elusimicrobiota bacterium]